MWFIYVQKVMNIKLLVFPVLLFLNFSAIAQRTINCEELLDQEPYFVKNKSAEKDLALRRDIEILKHCGNFNSIDSAFLKGPILGVLMLEQVNAGKPATYRTIIDFFTGFRKTAKYKDFSYGFSLYRKMGQKKVNLDDWETDKELFIRMGFTVNDLEDFKLYIARSENVDLTYMAVLTRYMTEIEEMKVNK